MSRTKKKPSPKAAGKSAKTKPATKARAKKAAKKATKAKASAKAKKVAKTKPAKKVATKAKPAAKKAAAKKPAAKKVATKKVATKEVATKKVATKKVATKKVATKKAASKKVATKKAASKKAASKKVATKKAASKAKPAAKKAAQAKPAAKKAAKAKPAKKVAKAKPAKKVAEAKPASEKVAKAKPAKAQPAAREFAGFPREGLQFLAELGLNNEREWFAENKPRYETLVQQPALAFIRAMGPRLEKITKEFEAVAKKSGGSLMRIYRDTRFSKDKTPYKTNIGIQFRHNGGKDVHAPGFYLHIEPGEAFLGCGMWRPDREPLVAVRRAIADTPAAWTKVVNAKPFAQHFELRGESLSRPPKDFDPEHPLIEQIKRKDHIAVCAIDPAALTDASLLDLVTERFKDVAPYVRFLCDAVSVAF